MGDLSPASLLGLVTLIAIGLMSESVAIALSVGGSEGRSSITFLPLLAAVQLFGPQAGALLIVVTLSFAEFAVRRKGLFRGSFNVAQALVAVTVAGWAFHLLGGLALRGPAWVEGSSLAGQLWPFVTFGLLFLGINHAAVALAIAFSQGLPFRRVWELVLRNSGGSVNDLLISPIALAVAFLYVQFGIVGILVVLLPMLFIRYSYLNTAKLREANEDLLTALVKAIETRDPYTSGHSQRVSILAGQIAEELGLPRRMVEQVQMAALLHDIGKIEALYTDILQKPSSLSADERAIIESHVTRGEQLLRDLSSVPEAVVLSVRHHHEREDGEGYPDGLRGNDIPIGAKIIVACDAIDAMLSDRPYRPALPLQLVEEQLLEHAGLQFDPQIVKILRETNLLQDYAVTMDRVRRPAECDEVSTKLPTTPANLTAPIASTRPTWSLRART
ncbi:MAG: HD-GYP domain-containing protein [Gemmatimonadota bacterium]|nr:HD-GYP domain-containing protein [Gemmatimonadota bacterium]